MNIERIKEIQAETGYPDSVSVQQALLKVWNECAQHQNKIDRKAAVMDFVKWLNKEYPPSGSIPEWLVDEYQSSISAVS